MTRREGFLSKDPLELEDLLVQVARRDRAPRAARERALSRVAAASAVVGVGTVAAVATGSGAVKSVKWLAFKWLAIGLGTTATALGVLDRVQRMPAETTGVARPAQSAGVLRREVSRKLELAVPVASATATPSASGVVLRAAPALLPPANNGADMPDAKSLQPELPVGSAVGSFAPPSAAELTLEVAALKRARAALAAGTPAQAMQFLNRYRADFPAGVLSTEEAALRIETVLAQGNRTLAAELAESFLKEHPKSPLAARVRRLSDSLGAPASKP